MHYTQLFRRLREQKGLSIESLARQARCHRNTVLNVEGGRPVRFRTLATLMSKMGYAGDSSEMSSLALLWLEDVSGVDLAEPAKLAPVRRKLSAYDRPIVEAAQELADTVRRARLDDREIRLLEFAAQRPEVLAIIGSVRDLLADGGADNRAELKVAEDK
jgi:transcriptional regulator with XRE-family HTH domain